MTLPEVGTMLRQWKLTKDRIVFFAIGFSAVLLYEFLARPLYRPYIYRNGINDYHLADTIGNTLGTVATIFVFLGVFGNTRTQNLFLIKTITLSVVVYELAHPLLGKPIDPWDVVATLVTGVLCLVLYRLTHPAKETEQGS
ncbi:MAG: hypothetical protein JNN04_17415 [Cyclobacteriaceae bacterium]|nr:hypothetical protein [Cyclobacteriaceae bacterium]